MRNSARAILIALISIAVFIARAEAARAPTTAPTTSRAPAIELLAHGTDELYWIARIEPGESDPLSQRTLIQMRSNASQHWRPLGELDGRAVALANRGSDLIVLLESGEWMLMWPSGGTPGQPLPFNARMLCIAGDERGDLWALGRGNIGPLVAETAIPTTASTTRSVPTSAPIPQAFGTAIFKWSARGWQPCAILSDSFSPLGSEVQDASMIVTSGHPVFALRDHTSRVHVLTLDGTIRDLGSVEAATHFELINSPQHATLWTSNPSPAGSISQIDESVLASLALAAPADLKSPQAVAIASATGQLRLVFARGGKVFEQAYNHAGRMSGTTVPLATIQDANFDGVMEWTAMAILLMLTFFVFSPSRRRATAEAGGRALIRSSSADRASGVESYNLGGARKDALHVAPLVPRIQAAVLDALPLIIASFVIAMRLQSAQPEDRHEIAQLFYPLYLIATAVYFLHTLISELLFRRTIGKWFFGLHVVRIDGTRAGVLAIVARNVVRVLEVTLFFLVFPIIVPFFTTYHQRIGDMAANTVVVSDNEPAKDENDQ